jgi:WD40 repeat protein
MQSIVSPIVATAVRPNSSTLVISCQNSKVYFWNFEDKRAIIQEVTVLNLQSDECPTCLNYSPNSKFLSVATAKGLIKFLEIDKNDVTPAYVAEIEKSHPVITMQVFSSDSRHLATMDKDYGVALFILQERWQIAGKIRVHHDAIRSIAFGEFLDEKGEPRLRLYSIAQDMKMAEYEVVETRKGEEDPANKYNKLKLKAIFPIEQECYPTACIWYPINLYKENVLLVVNEQYKLKLWNMLKDNLKICKRTCLGPTYGGEITKLLILNPVDEKNIYQDKYLAYATRDKVVGIIKLPLDGNPNNTLGLIAHSTDITGISSTIDGKLFFTSGSYDYCVNIWEVNIPALEDNFTVPAGHNPFPDLLEGGPDGAIRDLKDFFYYSQIRSKDEHSTKARKLDGKVPLEAIPNMMRSMGYYPTLK